MNDDNWQSWSTTNIPDCNSKPYQGPSAEPAETNLGLPIAVKGRDECTYNLNATWGETHAYYNAAASPAVACQLRQSQSSGPLCFDYVGGGGAFDNSNSWIITKPITPDQIPPPSDPEGAYCIPDREKNLIECNKLVFNTDDCNDSHDVASTTLWDPTDLKNPIQPMQLKAKVGGWETAWTIPSITSDMDPLDILYRCGSNDPYSLVNDDYRYQLQNIPYLVTLKRYKTSFGPDKVKMYCGDDDHGT
jgi:hypothetical protein